MTPYQVGGSLSAEMPSYVTRRADESLSKALSRGDFCYVLDSRQMGKSSLLVRAQAQLRRAGGCCTLLDLSNLGSQVVTPEQWYKGIGAELCLGFGLLPTLQFLTWWADQGDISRLQKLSRLIDQVLLERYPDTPVYVFVDEIDSVLSLDFSTDDFFALIRYCYNQRAFNAKFRHLSFAIAGVANPSDLIADKTRTPFNVGVGIKLAGLQLPKAAPLAAGLHPASQDPDSLLVAILAWTGGQPFLTQKLCQLAVEQAEEGATIPSEEEAEWVTQTVHDRIIHNWEAQDQPEHLRTIRDRLLRNQQRAGRWLGMYQDLLRGQTIVTDGSRDQTELLLLGLVTRQDGTLQIKNRIYQYVFNLEWVAQQLANLRPYSQALRAWDASHQTDQSRLLQGQALRDAQAWAMDKNLDSLDYQFLSASEIRDRQLTQQQLELAQAQAIEAKLRQERRASRLQRYLLGAVSLAFAITTGLSVIAFTQYRRALNNERQAEKETIRTLTTAAQALVVSDQSLDALISAVQADGRLQALGTQTTPAQLNQEVTLALRQTIFSASERNRFIGHNSNVNDVAFSPDGEVLASGGGDQNLRLWQRDGKLLKTIPIDADKVYAVDFSADGDLLAVAGGVGVVELRSATGDKLHSLVGHQATVWFVTFDPKGDLLATASQDGSVKVWSREGELLQTIQAHDSGAYGADISPDQQLIASASTDGTAKLWQRDGRLQTVLSGHEGPVWAVAFSPDGEYVATTGQDQTVRLWQLDGTPIKTLTGHSAAIWGLTFSPDGAFLVSTSVDNTAKLWDQTGTLLETLAGHSSTVWGVDVSPDGNAIATASWDQTIRLWQWPNPLDQTIYEPQDSLSQITFNPAGTQLVTSSLDGAIQLWSATGQLIKTIGQHDAEAWSVDISPDATYIVSGSADNTAKIWSPSGELLHTLTGHQDAVYAVAINPDGETIATGSIDGVIKLWRSDGTLHHTIETEQSYIFDLAFSPDGKSLAAGEVGPKFNIWSVTGERLHSTDQSSPVVSLSYSPDGRSLATVNDDNQIQLRHQDGTLIRTFALDEAATGFVSAIRFNPQGNLLATTSWNTFLKKWQIKLWRPDGTEVNTLLGHQGEIRSIAFSPDGNTLASASFDKSMILWNLAEILNLDERAFACDWIVDYLRTSLEVAENERTLCNN